MGNVVGSTYDALPVVGHETGLEVLSNNNKYLSTGPTVLTLREKLWTITDACNIKV